MSANGSKIAFTADARWIYTINADGTGLVQVFDYTFGVSNLFIDISADGSKIIWTSLGQNEIYIANFDGSNRQRIATALPGQFGGTQPPNTPLGARLTSDGSQVYFLHAGDGADVAGGYCINADGTGPPTKLFSYRQMAQLFNRDGSEYNGNVAFRSGFDISNDGSRMIFGTGNFGTGSFFDGRAITFDGGGLKVLTSLTGPVVAANGPDPGLITISNDGRKVAVAHAAFGEPEPVFSLNFDGSDQIEIIKDLGRTIIEMTSDGAQLLANALSITSLYNTNGSGRLDLNVFTCDLPFADPVAGANAGSDFNYGFDASITADGRRFAFVTRQTEPNQIWVADINPSSVGDAPAISEVNFTPTWVLTDGSTSSTFTARATGGQGGVRHVCVDPLKNSIYQSRAFSPRTLFDDGTNGDATASDGLYTNTAVRRDLGAPDPTGPYAVRFYAYANSLRQITAVDAVPFFILTTPPAGSAPKIDAITPSGGPAGIQVKITGSGFDPVTANNIVLFGNRQALVKTASSDRTMLEVIVPPDLATSVVPVTVTVAAQTSNAVNFNIVTSVQTRESLPSEFALSQNFPNPFNPSTTIAFSLPRPSHVTLKVFNLLGKEVATLVDKKFSAGRYEAHWDATGHANGVYFYRLEAEGNFVQTKKLLLVK